MREGTVEEMGPFAEGDDDQRPLCQHGEVKDIHPDIVFEYIQVDEEPHQKGCQPHQQQPDHKEPVGGLRELVQRFVLPDPARYEMDGDDGDKEALHITEHNDKKAPGTEPVEEDSGEEERQVGEHQHQVFQPAEVIFLIAIFCLSLGKHVDEQFREGSDVAHHGCPHFLLYDGEVPHPKQVGDKDHQEDGGDCQHLEAVTRMEQGRYIKTESTGKEEDACRYQQQSCDGEGEGTVKQSREAGPVVLCGEPSPQRHHQLTRVGRLRALRGAFTAVVALPWLEGLLQLIFKA